MKGGWDCELVGTLENQLPVGRGVLGSPVRQAADLYVEHNVAIATFRRLDMGQLFEVTVVKTAGLTVDLDVAREFLAAKDPVGLQNLEAEGDLIGIVDVYVSYVEGDGLDLDFDREIYVQPGSHGGTEGEEA